MKLRISEAIVHDFSEAIKLEEEALLHVFCRKMRALSSWIICSNMEQISWSDDMLLDLPGDDFDTKDVVFEVLKKGLVKKKVILRGGLQRLKELFPVTDQTTKITVDLFSTAYTAGDSWMDLKEGSMLLFQGELLSDARATELFPDRSPSIQPGILRRASLSFSWLSPNNSPVAKGSNEESSIPSENPTKSDEPVSSNSKSKGRKDFRKSVVIRKRDSRGGIEELLYDYSSKNLMLRDFVESGKVDEDEGDSDSESSGKSSKGSEDEEEEPVYRIDNTTNIEVIETPKGTPMKGKNSTLSTFFPLLSEDGGEPKDAPEQTSSALKFSEKPAPMYKQVPRPEEDKKSVVKKLWDEATTHNPTPDESTHKELHDKSTKESTVVGVKERVPASRPANKSPVRTPKESIFAATVRLRKQQQSAKKTKSETGAQKPLSPPKNLVVSSKNPFSSSTNMSPAVPLKPDHHFEKPTQKPVRKQSLFAATVKLRMKQEEQQKHSRSMSALPIGAKSLEIARKKSAKTSSEMDTPEERPMIEKSYVKKLEQPNDSEIVAEKKQKEEKSSYSANSSLSSIFTPASISPMSHASMSPFAEEAKSSPPSQKEAKQSFADNPLPSIEESPETSKISTSPEEQHEFKSPTVVEFDLANAVRKALAVPSPPATRRHSTTASLRPSSNVESAAKPPPPPTRRRSAADVPRPKPPPPPLNSTISPALSISSKKRTSEEIENLSLVPFSSENNPPVSLSTSAPENKPGPSQDRRGRSPVRGPLSRRRSAADVSGSKSPGPSVSSSHVQSERDSTSPLPRRYSNADVSALWKTIKSPESKNSAGPEEKTPQSRITKRSLFPEVDDDLNTQEVSDDKKPVKKDPKPTLSKIFTPPPPPSGSRRHSASDSSNQDKRPPLVQPIRRRSGNDTATVSVDLEALTRSMRPSAVPTSHAAGSPPPPPKRRATADQPPPPPRPTDQYQTPPSLSRRHSVTDVGESNSSSPVPTPGSTGIDIRPTMSRRHSMMDSRPVSDGSGTRIPFQVPLKPVELTQDEKAAALAELTFNSTEAVPTSVKSEISRISARLSSLSQQEKVELSKKSFNTRAVARRRSTTDISYTIPSSARPDQSYNEETVGVRTAPSSRRYSMMADVPTSNVPPPPSTDPTPMNRKHTVPVLKSLFESLETPEDPTDPKHLFPSPPRPTRSQSIKPSPPPPVTPKVSSAPPTPPRPPQQRVLVDSTSTAVKPFPEVSEASPSPPPLTRRYSMAGIGSPSSPPPVNPSLIPAEGVASSRPTLTRRHSIGLGGFKPSPPPPSPSSAAKGSQIPTMESTVVPVNIANPPPPPRRHSSTGIPPSTPPPPPSSAMQTPVSSDALILSKSIDLIDTNITPAPKPTKQSHATPSLQESPSSPIPPPSRPQETHQDPSTTSSPSDTPTIKKYGMGSPPPPPMMVAKSNSAQDQSPTVTRRNSTGVSDFKPSSPLPTTAPLSPSSIDLTSTPPPRRHSSVGSVPPPPPPAQGQKPLPPAPRRHSSTEISPDKPPFPEIVPPSPPVLVSGLSESTLESSHEKKTGEYSPADKTVKIVPTAPTTPPPAPPLPPSRPKVEETKPIAEHRPTPPPIPASSENSMIDDLNSSSPASPSYRHLSERPLPPPPKKISQSISDAAPSTTTSHPPVAPPTAPSAHDEITLSSLGFTSPPRRTVSFGPVEDLSELPPPPLTPVPRPSSMKSMRDKPPSPKAQRHSTSEIGRDLMLEQDASPLPPTPPKPGQSTSEPHNPPPPPPPPTPPIRGPEGIATIVHDGEAVERPTEKIVPSTEDLSISNDAANKQEQRKSPQLYALRAIVRATANTQSPIAQYFPLSSMEGSTEEAISVGTSAPGDNNGAQESTSTESPTGMTSAIEVRDPEVEGSKEADKPLHIDVELVDERNVSPMPGSDPDKASALSPLALTDPNVLTLAESLSPNATVNQQKPRSKSPPPPASPHPSKSHSKEGKASPPPPPPSSPLMDRAESLRLNRSASPPPSSSPHPGRIDSRTTSPLPSIDRASSPQPPSSPHPLRLDSKATSPVPSKERAASPPPPSSPHPSKTESTVLSKGDRAQSPPPPSVPHPSKGSPSKDRAASPPPPSSPHPKRASSPLPTKERADSPPPPTSTHPSRTPSPVPSKDRVVSPHPPSSPHPKRATSPLSTKERADSAPLPSAQTSKKPNSRSTSPVPSPLLRTVKSAMNLLVDKETGSRPKSLSSRMDSASPTRKPLTRANTEADLKKAKVRSTSPVPSSETPKSKKSSKSKEKKEGEQEKEKVKSSKARATTPSDLAAIKRLLPEKAPLSPEVSTPPPPTKTSEEEHLVLKSIDESPASESSAFQPAILRKPSFHRSPSLNTQQSGDKEDDASFDFTPIQPLDGDAGLLTVAKPSPELTPMERARAARRKPKNFQDSSLELEKAAMDATGREESLTQQKKKIVVSPVPSRESSPVRPKRGSRTSIHAPLGSRKRRSDLGPTPVKEMDSAARSKSLGQSTTGSVVELDDGTLLDEDLIVQAVMQINSSVKSAQRPDSVDLDTTLSDQGSVRRMSDSANRSATRRRASGRQQEMEDAISMDGYSSGAPSPTKASPEKKAGLPDLVELPSIDPVIATSRNPSVNGRASISTGFASRRNTARKYSSVSRHSSLGSMRSSITTVVSEPRTDSPGTAGKEIYPGSNRSKPSRSGSSVHWAEDSTSQLPVDTPQQSRAWSPSSLPVKNSMPFARVEDGPAGETDPWGDIPFVEEEMDEAEAEREQRRVLAQICWKRFFEILGTGIRSRLLRIYRALESDLLPAQKSTRERSPSLLRSTSFNLNSLTDPSPLQRRASFGSMPALTRGTSFNLNSLSSKDKPSADDVSVAASFQELPKSHMPSSLMPGGHENDVILETPVLLRMILGTHLSSTTIVKAVHQHMSKILGIPKENLYDRLLGPTEVLLRNYYILVVPGEGSPGIPSVSKSSIFAAARKVISSFGINAPPDVGSSGTNKWSKHRRHSLSASPQTQQANASPLSLAANQVMDELRVLQKQLSQIRPSATDGSSPESGTLGEETAGISPITGGSARKGSLDSARRSPSAEDHQARRLLSFSNVAGSGSKPVGMFSDSLENLFKSEGDKGQEDTVLSAPTAAEIENALLTRSEAVAAHLMLSLEPNNVAVIELMFRLKQMREFVDGYMVYHRELGHRAQMQFLKIFSESLGQQLSLEMVSTEEEESLTADNRRRSLSQRSVAGTIASIFEELDEIARSTRPAPPKQPQKEDSRLTEIKEVESERDKRDLFNFPDSEVDTSQIDTGLSEMNGNYLVRHTEKLLEDCDDILRQLHYFEAQRPSLVGEEEYNDPEEFYVLSSLGRVPQSPETKFDSIAASALQQTELSLDLAAQLVPSPLQQRANRCHNTLVELSKLRLELLQRLSFEALSDQEDTVHIISGKDCVHRLANHFFGLLLPYTTPMLELRDDDSNVTYVNSFNQSAITYGGSRNSVATLLLHGQSPKLLRSIYATWPFFTVQFNESGLSEGVGMVGAAAAELDHFEVASSLGRSLSRSVDITESALKETSGPAQRPSISSTYSGSSSYPNKMDISGSLLDIVPTEARSISKSRQANKVHSVSHWAKELDLTDLKQKDFRDTKVLRRLGFTLPQLRDARIFGVEDLLKAGFPLQEVKYLRGAAFSSITARDLRAAGYSVSQCVGVGFDAASLRAGGYNDYELTKSGLFSPGELRRIGCDVQRYILLAFFESTGGKHWRRSDGWGSPLPVSCWYGVHLNGAGCVVRLDLRSNQLKGKLPEELSLMSSLEYLDLYNNHLSGGVPDSYRYLGNLRNLWLTDSGIKTTRVEMQTILPGCRVRL